MKGLDADSSPLSSILRKIFQLKSLATMTFYLQVDTLIS
jgi:hypothetical protein